MAKRENSFTLNWRRTSFMPKQPHYYIINIHHELLHNYELISMYLHSLYMSPIFSIGYYTHFTHADTHAFSTESFHRYKSFWIISFSFYFKLSSLATSSALYIDSPSRFHPQISYSPALLPSISPGTHTLLLLAGDDLVFSIDAFSICDLKVSYPFSTSDHNSISCLLYCGATNKQQSPATTGYNLKRADWKGVCEELESLSWNDILSNKICDELWAAFYEIIFNVMDKYVLRCPIKRGVSRRKPYPKNIRRLQSRKLII